MALFEQLAVKYITDLVRDFDLKAFQAAGFPGNAGVESGGFTQTQEVNPTSGRGGLGHFQDTGPRRIEFEAWLARNADKNWSAGDYAANYSFLFRELEGDEKRVLAPLRASTTVEEATEIVMRVFERPALATANLPKRQDYGRRALAAFEASGIDEEALRAQGRPGATSVTLPPAPQLGQILPPLPKIDPNTLAPIINALAPVLLQLLAARVQPATGGQQAPPTDLAGMLGQLLGGLAPKPVPPVPPPAPVVVATTKESNPLSMLFSVLLGAGTAATMSTGHLGTPFGFGMDPTLSGSLMTIASIASPLIAMIPGGYGVFVNAGISLLRGIAGRLPPAPTK